MAETVTFRAALAHVGLLPAVLDTIVEQGITTIGDLLIFQKDQIKHLCKVIQECPVNPWEVSMRHEQLLETRDFGCSPIHEQTYL
jgi:hypothetical protein